MSIIIEDEIFLFNNPDERNIKGSNTNRQKAILKKLTFQKELNHRIFQTFAIHSCQKDNSSLVKLVIPYRKRLFESLDVWYQVNINEKGVFRDEKLIIAKDDFLYKIRPFKKRLEAIRQICRFKQRQPKFAKIYISDEGVIYCIIPKIILNQNLTSSFRFNSKNSSKTPTFSSYIENIIGFCLADVKLTLKNIFNRLTDLPIQQQNPFKEIQKEEQMKALKFDLYRYLARSPVELRFDCTEGSAQYEQVVDITLTQEKQIQQRIGFMREANLFKFTSIGLYLEETDIFEGKQKEAFFMTAKQKEITKNLLEIPQVTLIKQGNGPNNVILENKYIFNSIILELPPENQILTGLGQSGFGKFEFGNFGFWYLMNSKIDDVEMEQTLKESNKIKNKYLVVKSPKLGTDRQSVAKYLSKQMHEIQIINKLKGISCALIPRFYKVENMYPKPFTEIQKQASKKYENALMSELSSWNGCPGYNVGNLIQERWQTLSLKKVIYIMSQVSQVLRFLHINKIVHLDLKPENILFMKNFAIKMIDFGEAYHPLVPYGDSTPAYSYPYGSPEISHQLLSFPEKSDVFSFGVILYELIYGKDLITTNPSLLLKNYKEKNFTKRIFFNPEELESYGEDIVLPMLNHLIIKALSSQVDARPAITWISVLLKKYLQVLP